MAALKSTSIRTVKLLLLTPIKEVMPERHHESEKEEVDFKGGEEIEIPADFVTLGK